MELSTHNLQLVPEAAIDLQLHTTYSDGSWTLPKLCDYLLSENFELVAITDHDRVDTLAEIQDVARKNQLPVLVAVEMSSTWQGKMVDLLCFGFDLHQPSLTKLTQDVLERQKENTREVYENLKGQGYILQDDMLSAVLAQPSSRQPHSLLDCLTAQYPHLNRTEIGQAMKKAGYALETNEPLAIVEATHQSGGVCLLAHPGRTDGFITYTTELLDTFRQDVPIDGLEVYYPRHTAAQTAMYQQYAEHHHLLISAGSDSHGAEKPPIKYKAERCRSLLERVGIQLG